MLFALAAFPLHLVRESIHAVLVTAVLLWGDYDQGNSLKQALFQGLLTVSEDESMSIVAETVAGMVLAQQ